jgi:hypothetical protein
MIIDAAYRDFCVKRFPLPTSQQVADLERRIGVPLPDDYRQFILDYNGGYFERAEIAFEAEGCPLDNLRCLHGIGASHATSELATERHLAVFEGNDPPAVVPIGNTVAGGLILLVVHAESLGCILLKVAFGDSFLLASGIEGLFSLLRTSVEDE